MTTLHVKYLIYYTQTISPHGNKPLRDDISCTTHFRIHRAYETLLICKLQFDNGYDVLLKVYRQ